MESTWLFAMASSLHRIGSHSAEPLIVWLVVLAFNLCVSAYLAVLIVQALGGVSEGQAIRPMGLFAHLLGVSIFAFVCSALIGIKCPLADPRRLASYGLGLLTAFTGLIPFGVSMVVTQLIIDLRSLVLAD
jgi:hypothetical protein